MKKYNHAYTIAFSIDSDNGQDEVTDAELIKGLALRLIDVMDTGEIAEAVGFPFDTYENEPMFKKGETNG